VVRETQQVVDNGFEEVYVNTEIKDNSEVSQLMEVFSDDNIYNDKFPKTSEGKYRYKNTEGGLNAMCEIMEKIAEEERTEGRQEAIAMMVINMSQNNMTTQQIASIARLSVDEVEKILHKAQ
jgi:predicted transposase/invertase (TIGR01784 family)